MADHVQWHRELTYRTGVNDTFTVADPDVMSRLRQWKEEPDKNRRTGRTTKMIQTIKAHKERPIVVVAGNSAQAKFIKKQLEDDDIDTNRVVFTCVGKLDTDTRGLSMETKYFWDHLAVEIWQRNQIKRVMQKAQQMWRQSL